MAEDIPFVVTNYQGYNSYVATLSKLSNGDTDTEVLFLKPTAKKISVFINNPSKDTIQMLGSNLPQQDITLSDMIPRILFTSSNNANVTFGMDIVIVDDQ